MTDNQRQPIIFLAFANDQEQGNRYLRLLNKEANELRDLLEGADAPFEVVVRQGVGIDDILNTFQDPKYRHRIAMYHYGGHADSYRLLFEGREGQREVADATGLATFLAQQRGLELVFLNGCETEEQAQGLLEAGVKAVIATDQKIRDDVAVDFALRFYRGLMSDQPLQQAFAEAEAAMHTKLGDDQARAYRDAGFDDGIGQVASWPWRLHLPNASEAIADWRISTVTNNPYFGLPPLPRQRRLPSKPFRGLSYFTEKDAALFFGRGWQIRKLFDLIANPDLTTNPIILLYGQSGVGKSSLLAAGLLPRLKQEAEVRYIRREDANNNLTTALHMALLPSFGSRTSLPAGGRAAQEPNTPPTNIDTSKIPPISSEEGRAGNSLADAWLAQETDERPLVIILDQVEEIYSRPGPDPAQELADFLAVLQSIFDDASKAWPQGTLVLGFRKEWLAEIRDRLQERNLPNKEMFIKHLDKEGIIEAITGPATTPQLKAQYDLEVLDDVPIVIADDLLADRGSAIAPTLQIILTKLWENAKGKPKVFDRDLYDDLRLSPANFLGQLLDQQLTLLAQDHPDESESGLVLDMLAYHTTEFGTTEQWNRAELLKTYHHLPSATIEELVRACTNRYLLVDPSGTEDKEAPDATRLTHDTLGPLVRARFDISDKPGQRAARILKNRVTSWRTTEGAPLDEEDLARVENGYLGMRAWDKDEVRVVKASQKARDRHRFRSRIFQALTVTAIIVIVGLLIWSEIQRGIAGLALAEARSRELAAKSTSAFTARKDTEALLLAIEAGTQAGTFEAFQAIYAPLDRQAKIQSILQHEGSVQGVQWNSDESLILIRSDDSTVWVWDTADGTEKFILPHEDFVQGAQWNSDGSLILTRSDDGTVWVWDAADGTEKFILPHEDFVWEAQWNSDESLILTHSDDGIVRVWDAADGTEKFILPHENFVRGVQWNSDGSLILTRSDDGIVRVWDAANETEKFILSHEGSVNDAQWNSDGSLILTNSFDDSVRVWNAADGTEKFILPHEDFVWEAQWNSDGSLILTSSFDDSVRVWNTADGTEKFILPHEDFVQGAQWNSDGSLILTRSDDGTVWVWDAADGTEKFILPHEDFVWEAQWNSDESLILTHSDDGIVRVWNAADGTEKFILPHEDFVWEAQWNSDGSLILTRGFDDTVRVWDAANETEKFILSHEGSVNDAQWNSDGSLIVTHSDDGTVRVWNAADGAKKFILRHEGWIQWAQWNSDGSLIATHSDDDNTVRVWDATDGTEKFILPHEGSVQWGRWNSNGSLIATHSDDDNTVRVWDATDGTEKFILPHEGSVQWGRWNSNGSLIVTHSDDDTVRVWDAANGTEKFILPHEGSVQWAQWNNDESLIVTRSDDGIVRVWNAADGTEKFILPHEGSVQWVQWNSDESLILTRGFDDTVRVWDAADGMEKFILPHEGSVQWAQWNSDGSLIATHSDDDNTVRVWDATDGTEKFILPHEGSVQWGRWNSNGSLIVTHSDDDTVRVWDAANGTEKFILPHEGSVQWAQWNNDESLILTLSDDGIVRVWDATDGMKKFILPHEGSVQWGRWNSDGSLILTRSDDGTVRVWDAVDGVEKFILPHEDFVWEAQWNSDESLILTLSGGTVQVWETRLVNLLTLACTRVPLNMSHLRWQQYFQGQSYQSICPKAQIPLETINEIIEDEVKYPAGIGDMKVAFDRLTEVKEWLVMNKQYPRYEADFETWLTALEQGQNPFEE